MPSTSLEFDEPLRCNHDHDCCGYGLEVTCVKIAATADLPNKFGQFQCEGAMRDVGEHEPSAEKNRISYARPELLGENAFSLRKYHPTSSGFSHPP